MVRREGTDGVAARAPKGASGLPGVGGAAREAHDLVIAKLVAGREKDLDFARAPVRHGLVSVGSLAARLSETELPGEKRAILAARIEALAAART